MLLAMIFPNVRSWVLWCRALTTRDEKKMLFNVQTVAAGQTKNLIDISFLMNDPGFSPGFFI
jgi:hypothetical protein